MERSQSAGAGVPSREMEFDGALQHCASCAPSTHGHLHPWNKTRVPKCLERGMVVQERSAPLAPLIEAHVWLR